MHANDTISNATSTNSTITTVCGKYCVILLLYLIVASSSCPASNVGALWLPLDISDSLAYIPAVLYLTDRTTATII
jgi:hypothetical protein